MRYFSHRWIFQLVQKHVVRPIKLKQHGEGPGCYYFHFIYFFAALWCALLLCFYLAVIVISLWSTLVNIVVLNKLTWQVTCVISQAGHVYMICFFFSAYSAVIIFGKVNIICKKINKNKLWDRTKPALSRLLSDSFAIPHFLSLIEISCALVSQDLCLDHRVRLQWKLSMSYLHSWKIRPFLISWNDCRSREQITPKFQFRLHYITRSKSLEKCTSEKIYDDGKNINKNRAENSWKDELVLFVVCNFSAAISNKIKEKQTTTKKNKATPFPLWRQAAVILFFFFSLCLSLSDGCLFFFHHLSWQTKCCWRIKRMCVFEATHVQVQDFMNAHWLSGRSGNSL